MADKKADLAGPGIGDYDVLERILPKDYKPLLNPKDTQKAIFAVKNYIVRIFSRYRDIQIPISGRVCHGLICSSIERNSTPASSLI